MYGFFVENGLVFELIFSLALFFWQMERRSGFAMRLAASVLVFLLASIFFNQTWPGAGAWGQTLQYLLFLSLAGLGIWNCFKVEMNQAIFHITAACVTQHMAFTAAGIAEGAVELVHRDLILFAVTHLFLTVLVNLLAYFVFARRMRRGDTKHLPFSTALLCLAGMILFTNLFQNLFRQYDTGITVQLRAVFSAFDLVCCLFLLNLQCEICSKKQLERDNDILTHVLYQQKEQMEISKKTIDVINVKCHDLKRQISSLGTKITADEMEELKHAINIYETSVKTGNEALDVILAEKSLLCENEKIRFDCMADGGILNFMTPSDIYSLFGNALDNAMEAVRKTDDPEARYISLSVKRQKGMVVIRCENPYAGTISFHGKLPVTTKRDKQYHGFGVQSIQMIAEKYEGGFAIKAENGIFRLNVLLPFREV